jgi:L-fucose mutarotase/ribose pyranase (RbsD/FucU family)
LECSGTNLFDLSLSLKMLLLSAVLHQVLEEDNYVNWSVRVQAYLMAHDLWEIIEATIEPLRQEDDEATFKAWSKKNSTALHIIQISCSSNAFSKIIEISSAKIAWDTLARNHLQVLEEDNYVDWSMCVKTYLMAHDLWEIIEATTEQLRQEDDEAIFKAQSKKNFTALHIIQISCGSDTFSKIVGISSAQIAWDTLAKNFLQVLEEDNYVDWSVRVKTYLMAHDLWETVEATAKPPKQEDDEVAFKAWSKKNFLTLHIIQISCGSNTFSEIIEISSAKSTWDMLAKKYLQVFEDDNYVDWSVRVKTYLMAHDLWEIIEPTTEPLRQEDDETTIKALSKKNSTALHIIQISCSLNTFSEIIEISSAKLAWDTLAKKYLQVLEENNYLDWSVRVKTYLMAHDLWETIEATTETPKQEDDEAAFKAWSKKNSTALHIIQFSCGVDTFSEIIKISSAKIAWDMLAKKYLQVLEEDNYIDWSVWVKTYLMAHDLWETVEETTEPPKQEDDEAAFKAWSKKNSTALHVIQISSGLDTFYEIIEISSAKIAWDTLAKKYNSGLFLSLNNMDAIQHFICIISLIEKSKLFFIFGK